MKLHSRHKSIPFYNLRCYHFVPELKERTSSGTCGTTLLRMVTGLSARTIEKYKPKNQTYWSDRAVCNFLKNRGFLTYELGEMNVLKDWQSPELTNPTIKSSHIIISNNRVDREDASWFLTYKNKIYHNFQEVTHVLFFLNFPIQNAFVIWHKKFA